MDPKNHDTEEWTVEDHIRHTDALIQQEQEDRKIQDEVNQKAETAYRQADLCRRSSSPNDN